VCVSETGLQWVDMLAYYLRRNVRLYMLIILYLSEASTKMFFDYLAHATDLLVSLSTLYPVHSTETDN